MISGRVLLRKLGCGAAVTLRMGLCVSRSKRPALLWSGRLLEQMPAEIFQQLLMTTGSDGANTADNLFLWNQG